MIIQIPFIPVSIIGIILMTYRESVVPKNLGVSPTTLGATGNKWILHHFGTRPDQATVEFCKALPMESHFGLLATFGAAIIANRLVGYKPSIAALPEPGTENLITFQNLKTIEFDRFVEEHVDHVKQIVVMGAGFDLRVLRFAVGKNVDVYELDLENVQNLKLETLKEAAIPHDWVTYIPVDFNTASWADELCAAGFDKSKQTLFLAESVLPYFPKSIVLQTIEKISELSAPGSVFAKDFFSTDFVEGLKKMSSTMRALSFFSLDMSDDVRALIASFFTPSRFEVTRMSLFGEKSKKGKPFCAIATATKL